MKALVVGGTGPTGPAVIRGLLDRGHDVTLFNRGVHSSREVDALGLRHIKGDPHFVETISEAVGAESFDLVLAMYGRARHLVSVLGPRAGRFVAISGTPVYAGYNEPDLVHPFGLTMPVTEESPLADTIRDADRVAVAFAHKMVDTERIILNSHPSATVLRYSVVYGPRNPIPWEWSVVKRVLDGRSRILLPDGGLALYSRLAVQNAAEMVLRVVDHPEQASGHAFNCAEDALLTLRQWVELIALAMGADIEIVGVPAEVAPAAQAIYMPLASPLTPHCVLDNTKIKSLLGYRDVVSPVEALAESVDWYVRNPVIDPASRPGYMDRFDYALEDQVMDSWRATVQDLLSRTPQPGQAPLHGMPHPKAPNEHLRQVSQ